MFFDLRETLRKASLFRGISIAHLLPLLKIVLLLGESPQDVVTDHPIRDHSDCSKTIELLQ